MKNKIAGLLSLFCFATAAQSVIGVDTILKSGPISKRINFVFLGDGYDNTQTAQQVIDATTVSNYLLSIPPFSNYNNYINAFVIKCVSTQSGVTHPGTATDVSEPASPVMSVTNYFNTSFDVGNIHRLMYSNNSTAVYNVLSTWFPLYTQPVILGNSVVYGGAGGSYACASMNSSSQEIAAHEIGHSFAGLSDEYWLGSGSEGYNMTANSNTATVKWSQWVGVNSVGVYPYGSTFPANTWFRPHQNCKMQYLGTPFCSVCSQTVLERIHALTNPIDAYSPSNASSVFFTPGSQWFKTVLVKPNPNTLKRKWDLNSTTVSNNTDSVLISSGSLTPGSNTLKVTVIDTTALTKDVNHPTLHSYSVIWNINYSPAGIAEVKTQMEYSIFPNPVTNFVNLKYNLKEGSSILISVVNAEGKKVLSKNLGKQDAGEYLHEIDVQELTAGNYFLTIQINDKIINNQFVVFK
jgi:hypothetical protein